MSTAVALCTFDPAQASQPVVPALVHAGRSTTCGTYITEGEGPLVLIIGSLAAPMTIRNLARRHGIEPGLLLQFARQGEAA